MERLGFEPIALIRQSKGAGFAEARANCIDCRHARQCRSWLDASIVMTAPPNIRANAHAFEQLKVVPKGQRALGAA